MVRKLAMFATVTHLSSTMSQLFREIEHPVQSDAIETPILSFSSMSQEVKRWYDAAVFEKAEVKLEAEEGSDCPHLSLNLDFDFSMLDGEQIDAETCDGVATGED
jgi:hypothetical protein